MKSRLTFALIICFAFAAFAFAEVSGVLEDPPPPEDKPIEEEPPPVTEEHPPGGQIPEDLAEKKEGEKEEKWNVSTPPGPSFETSIDVREGTWMSLDVSPDGREIAFDLLGDIYVMPIEGGEARNLTHGVEWDMQPVYSPDGEWIAFTSDRSGGDNIWIMRRDGSDPKQVTKETFRLVNSPAWTPDGQFIVARKHFTSRRSLGAGEMWLYHRAGGGEGLQMTKRPNDQKDAGEPVFSPDGRYLYYSQDTTPGATFEYNKDPNSQIYVIQRLDRETGETEAFVTGPGGAIRPTPSPDGKMLAFVRRVRYDSVLHVMDLVSGKITPIHRGLERDMQETWAVHGVYPRLAWTPDSRSVILWSGGTIHRLDIASGESRAIPFHVRDTRQMTEVVRFPVDVAPERFDVRMLRWVSVSPKGDRVVYQALGHLWIRDLPEGSPRRLTKQNDHFEFYPSWSRDSRSIVYSTWDDQKLGSIRTVAAAGGEGRAVTSQPGHYLEPVFTPDGREIVYRKVGGGYLRSPLYSFDPGLYRVPAGGGASTLVTKRGIGPQFAAASDRVYFIAFGDEGVRELRSIELDGSDERLHVTSAEASEFALSPDGKWLAFTEQFNAWVMPFVATGQKIEVAPKGSAIPQARVSRDAGEYIHWSGDSRKLYWALGPELYERELAEAFEFMEGAPEELPGPPETGRNISLSAGYGSPSGTIALVGGRVVTMKGDEVIEDAVVVVEGNRIRAVGRRSDIEIPRGARTIDVAGKTVVPGFVDVHWHGSMGQDEIIPEQNWVLYSSLAFGVTTVHDPSNDTSEIFAASELAKAGRITAPRIFSTGTILYGAKAPFRAVIESLEDARSHLRRMKAVGAFSVKSYSQPRRDQRQQVIAAARELEMMVVPEGGSLFQHNMNMVVDGHTGIEHSIPVANIYDDVLQLWGSAKVGYTPTLVVGYGGLFGEEYWYQKTNVWENERLLAFVPRRYVDPRARRRTMAPDDEFNHFNNARAAAQLANKGVQVQIGAHGQREGLGAHWELWMFEQGGMTPHQALRAATLWGAEYLGLDGDIGSIEAGKLADLIVIDGNPLEDLRSSEQIRYTMINGRLYDAMSMREVAPGSSAPEPFWFSEPAR